MKKQPQRLALVLGILVVLVAGMARADTSRPSLGFVEILEGQGEEVCEACFKALDVIASKAGAVGLSGCERYYTSEYGLSAPQWTDLPPLKHLSLLKKAMLFLRPVDPDFYGTGRSSMYEGTIYETDETFRRQIKGELKTERIAIAETIVDIDNDGRPEPVFRYRQGDCPDPNVPPPPRAAHPSRALVVLTPDHKSIDQAKTDIVTQNLGKTSEVPAGDFFDKLYDVFFFKGQKYFDQWDRSPDPDTVTVYQAKGKSVTSLCKFRYEIPYRPQSFGGKP